MQSKFRFFAGFLLIFSLTLGLFLTLSPKGVEANNGQGRGQGQETCPNTGNGWIKVEDLTSKTYEYTAPAGKLVSKVCYKASTVVTYYDVVPAKEKVLVESTAINNGGQIADLSHASFLLIDKPVVEEEDDNGEVQGVTTEVKGTTTVVLAATSAGDRSTVYLIQSLLMLVTGVSLIFVGREYLNRA